MSAATSSLKKRKEKSAPVVIDDPLAANNNNNNRNTAIATATATPSPSSVLSYSASTHTPNSASSSTLPHHHHHHARSPHHDGHLAHLSKKRDRRAAGFAFLTPGQFAAREAEAEAEAAAAAEAERAARERVERQVALVDVTATEVEGSVGVFENADVSDLGPEPPSVEWWDAAATAEVSAAVTVPTIAQGTCASTSSPGSTTVPVILTPQERAKERKRMRQERAEERREKIKAGELPEPSARLTMNNVQQVLRHTGGLASGVTDLEQRVREDEARRRQNHEDRNAANKLTAEARGVKLREKHLRQAEEGMTLSAYRVVLDGDEVGKNVWKVQTNASQLHITGVLVRVGRVGLIVVEAGKKPTGHMDKLITHRIKTWGGQRVFQGPATTHRFDDFAVREFDDDDAALTYLRDRRCEACWDAARLLTTGPTVDTVL
eukprot:PhM_4_TR1399/c0_g1_i1/m.66906/K12843/PRPF3, PRP3; U4/U6 small nuclear ribonucleoprotein PRP3